MQKLPHQLHSFDEFTLDLTRGCLLRLNEEVKLRPKAFDVLSYLVENNGRLVSKDELIHAVWIDTAVTDDSLVQCLMEVRRALGGKAQPFIKTVPSRGYIFDKEVSDDGATSTYTEETTDVHVVIEEAVETNGPIAGGAIETSPGKNEIVELRKQDKVASLIGAIRRHKLATTVALAGVVLIGAGLTYAVLQYFRPPAMSFKPVSIERFTTDSSGQKQTAAISPDGNYVAYVSKDAGMESLWVRQVTAVNPRQMAAPDKAGYRMLTFSPDGSFVYYVQANVLYQVPVLGGAARKMLEGVKSAITFSPDGKRFAFVRANKDHTETRLMLANADGSGEEQTLATRKLPEFLMFVFDNGPVWSPDGKTIACPGGEGGGFGQMYPIEVRVADGTQKPMTTKRWGAVLQMAWLADGSGLLMNARDNEIDETRQIWYVSYPGGVPQRILNDFNSYDSLSLSANSGTLVTVQREEDSHIWVVGSQDEPGSATQITFGTGRQDGLGGMDTTPAGKIVYSSMASGGRDWWVMDADGSNQKQLTFNRRGIGAIVSPDGRLIVYGSQDIEKIDVDGGNLPQVADGNLKQVVDRGGLAIYSPDGKWIVYVSQPDGWTLWKIPSDGGEPVRLTDQSSIMAAISPDGKLIAYRDITFGAPRKLKVIPFDGGRPLKVFEVAEADQPAWAPDGQAIDYLINHKEDSQIVSQPLDGSSPKVLFDFKSKDVRGFAWSRDGKQLFFVVGTTKSNVVLMKLER
jgi:eukaryotic-like serine/threonine-protein kinase